MTVRTHAAFIAGFVAMMAAHVPLHAKGDDDLPSVEILAPQMGKAVAGKAAPLRISYQRGKYPIKHIVFFVDDLEHFTDRGKFADNGEIDYDFKTTDFTDGLHQLAVRIVDAKGYSSQQRLTIFIANAPIIGVFPPQVKITNLTMNQTIRGPYSVGVRATSETGVAWIVLIVNHPPSSNRPATISARNMVPENHGRDNAYQYTFPWDTTQLPNGTYIIQAKAIDFFERPGFSDRIYVLVNNLAGRSDFHSEKETVPAQRSDNNVVVVTPKTMALAPTSKEPVATVHPPDDVAVLGADAKVLFALGGPVRPGASVPDSGTRMIVLPPKTTLAGLISEVVAAAGAGKAPNVRMLAVRPGLAAPTLDMRGGGARPSMERIIIIGEPLLADWMQLASPLIRRARAAGPASDLPDSRIRGSAQTPVLGIAGLGAVTSANTAMPSLRKSPSMSPPTLTSSAPDEHAARTAQLPSTLKPSTGPAVRQTSNLGPNGGVTPSAMGVNMAKTTIPLTKATTTAIVSRTSQMKTAMMSLGHSPHIGKTNDVTLALPGARRTKPEPSATAIKRADLFTTHVVRHGETLVDIARSYAVPDKVIASVNSIRTGKRLTVGHSLRIPRTFSTYVNGREVRTNVKAFPTKSVPAAPFRAVVEGIGGKVDWNATTRTVSARTVNKAIILRIGDREAKVNDQKVMMDLAAFLFSGRTMVPTTFFKTALDATIVVDPETGSITITVP